MFGVVGALALGALVFLQLQGNQASIERARIAEQQAALQAAQPPPAQPYYPPPPPEPEPEPEPEPPTTLVDVAPPPPLPPGPTQAELDRLRAPALVVDLGEFRPLTPGAAGAQAVTPTGTPGPGGPLDAAAIASRMTGAADAGAATSLNSNERFAQRFGGGPSTTPTSAQPMGDLSTTIIEGSLIPAVLETALNSDAPGYVRGVVTRDVRGFDGSKVLVPRGSRMIGEYNSGTVLGQRRAFVIWTRLIRPDGATVDLGGARATDGLGQGGIGGKVDTHFLQRFGGAILLSLLNIGASAVSDSADTTVVIAGARAGADAAGQALGGQGADIGPTITVMQGTPLRVFVSQDMSFAAVGAVEPTDAGN
jgi:type IV secretion system protein VirB10